MGMSSTILQVVEESLRYSESRVLVDSGKASWGKGLCKWRPEKAPFWDGGGGGKETHVPATVCGALVFFWAASEPPSLPGPAVPIRQLRKLRCRHLGRVTCQAVELYNLLSEPML